MRFSVSSVIGIAVLHTLTAFGENPSDPAADRKHVNAPPITQEEILDALGLEISKIRIVKIPKGEQITLELVEWTEKPLKTRTLTQVSLTPETDWMELLISAQSTADGCRSFKMKLSHASPISKHWLLDIEKQFGAGKRAIPREHSLSLIDIEGEFPYEHQAFQVAKFRLSPAKPGRFYMIMLNAFTPPKQTKN